MSLVYDVFRGSDGDPPDVSAPVATVSGLTWTDPAVAPGATTSYLVRARDTATGLSDRNGDARLDVTVGDNGLDFTGVPAPPRAVRAIATRAGGARVEWAYPLRRGAARPLGFRVYLGVGTPDYSTPRAVVPFRAASPRGRRATLSGLADGVAYAVGVRAWNAAGEESNAATATVVGSAAAPASVAGLTATSTSTSTSTR